MKFRKRLSILLLLSSLHEASAENMQQSTDKLINQIDPSINMSALIVDLNTDETLFSRNASRVLIPASNMKLFSEAAALLVLGPEYRFKTELSTNASHLENGVLQGSLYLNMPGDPSFTTGHLDALLAELPKWGVKKIDGDVILISSHANIDAYPPGWSEKDFLQSYGAPLAPLILDENRLTVTVNPHAKANQPAFIELSQKESSIHINNQVNTVTNPKGCGLSYLMDDKNNLNVRGCVAVGQWAAVQRIPIRNPLQYAEGQIRARLKAVGVTLNGQVKLGAAPEHTLLLATHESKPITQLLADTLKPSDNLYADSLYLHAAHLLTGHPVNWGDAQAVIKTFLQKQTGISLNTAVLTDGSGLSREDRLSAQQTVALLQYLHRHFPLTYEYIAALPIAGQDGTLQKRLKKPYQQGFIRAKTGTLSGVVSLSGYLYTANAHTLAFALYINRSPKTNPNVSGRYRPLIDTICDYFLRQKPENKKVVSLPNAHERVSFQQRPTRAELQRNHINRWRRLEYAIKQSLKGLPVVVLFRNDHLILQDQGHDHQSVWQALQQLQKKYSFAIAVEGISAPESHRLLWIKNKANNATRTWTLLDAARF